MRRLSSLMLYAGAGICMLGVIGLVGGFWFNLSPEAVRRIAMALPFALGGLLLVIGALVGRASHRHAEAQGVPELPLPAADAAHVGRSARSDARDIR